VSQVPDLVDKVIGFRAWSIGRPYRRGLAQMRNEDLWSIGNHAVRWDSRTMTARCLQQRYGLGGVSHPDHPPPYVRCKCGIYANHRLGWPSSAPEGMCIGAVAAWGRLQVHGRGFRAEHAEILAFGYAPAWTSGAIARIGRLAARFRVPLVPLRWLPDVALEHGSPVPVQLRPGDDTPGAFADAD
jgi:hypothetical protein